MDTMYCHEHGDITTHDDECPLCLVADLKAQVAKQKAMLSDYVTWLGERDQQVAEKDRVIEVLADQLQVDSFYRIALNDECPRCERSPVMDYNHKECWIKWAEAKAKEA